MFGAHLACSSTAEPSSSTPVDQRVHVVRALDRLGQQAAQIEVGDLAQGRPARRAAPRPPGRRPSASASVSVVTCTTPLRRPCGSGPPRRSMSTSSPVTERTTSGPVTKMRPSGPRITMSVSAGPYAAPPAAAPSTTEICGIRPDARVMMAKTSPTACSDETPSRSRAPPECQRPTTGTPSASARSYAARIDLAARPCPSRRPGPAGRRRSATTGLPSTRPIAASMPESSSAVIGVHEPPSKRASRRTRGLRGSRSTARVGAAWSGRSAMTVTQALLKARATLWPPKPNELFSAAIAPLGSGRGLAGGDVEADLVVGVVEVDGRRDDRGGAAPAAWRSTRPRRRHRAGARSWTWSPMTTAVSAASPRARVDRGRLGHVALRRRGGVRVDVDDVAGRQAGVGERRDHGPGGARAHRVGLGDVVGVGGDPGAGELGVDPGARGPPRARPTPARRCRRPRRGRSRRGPCRTGARPARARRCASTAPSSRRTPAIGSGWMQASVPPATTTSARPRGSSRSAHGDRLGAGRAGRDRRVHAGPGAQLEADHGGRAVRHEHRDGERRDAPRALLLERVVRLEERHRAPDARRRPRRRAAAGRRRARRRRPTPRGRRSARAAATGRAGAPPPGRGRRWDRRRTARRCAPGAPRPSRPPASGRRSVRRAGRPRSTRRRRRGAWSRPAR